MLSAAVSYWTEALAIDPDREMQNKQAEDYQSKIKDWMSNKRAIGLLGDRVSGALLLNGKDPNRKEIKSILKRKR